jgi:hypothetical protein
VKLAWVSLWPRKGVWVPQLNRHLPPARASHAGLLVAIGMAAPAVTHAVSGHTQVAAAYCTQASKSAAPSQRLATKVKESRVRWTLYAEHAPFKIIEPIGVTVSTILVGAVLAYNLQRIYGGKARSFKETVWWTWGNVSERRSQSPVRGLEHTLFRLANTIGWV